MPKVSIIVPIYNAEEFLPKALDRLVNQTLQDIEIICVNDGSTDNSIEILKAYEKQDKRIIVINQENCGVGAARNRGLEIAQGEYIGFVDPDDWLDETMYEKLYASAKENNSDISLCDFRRFNEEKNTFTESKYIRKVKDSYKFEFIQDLKPMHKKKEFFNENLLIMPMFSWNKIYRNSVIQTYNIRFQPIYYMEDIEFNLYAFKYAKEISFIDEPLYTYRIRNSSMLRIKKIEKRNLFKYLGIYIEF